VTSPLTGTATLHILLVEDEELNRDLIRAILTRAKHPALTHANLVEAATLAAARAALAAQAIDILLLDVHLPDGSGLTLAQELAANPPAKPPVVIALTAGIFPSEQKAAVDAGCRTILSKPHTAGELLAVLAPHLPACAESANPPAP
jgi:two-component system KDP operon response regulator KdpE